MSWRRLLEPKIQGFIRENRDADVAALALKKPPSADWPYPLILDQIKARQKAQIKTPQLHALEGFLFPPPFVYEQASSEACAAFRARVFGGKRVLDATGGSGVDAFFMARAFSAVTVLECDPLAVSLLRHNTDVVQKSWPIESQIAVHETRAEAFLTQGAEFDLIFLDPQRRSNKNKGLFRFEDCSPDVTHLLPLLRRAAPYALIKASPILDIAAGIKILRHVSEVHVLSWMQECKEILYKIDFTQEKNLNEVKISAFDLDDKGAPVKSFSFRYGEEQEARAVLGPCEVFIFEPGPAFLKAAPFQLLAQRSNLRKLHPSAHLYTGSELRSDFPGKTYRLERVLPASGEGLPEGFAAELVTRHFPIGAHELRRKLKLREGDQHRIFATTFMDGRRALLVCSKISNAENL